MESHTSGAKWRELQWRKTEIEVDDPQQLRDAIAARQQLLDEASNKGYGTEFRLVGNSLVHTTKTWGNDRRLAVNISVGLMDRRRYYVMGPITDRNASWTTANPDCIILERCVDDSYEEKEAIVIDDGVPRQIVFRYHGSFTPDITRLEGILPHG